MEKTKTEVVSKGKDEKASDKKEEEAKDKKEAAEEDEGKDAIKYPQFKDRAIVTVSEGGVLNIRESADPEAEITVTDYDSACLKGLRKLLVQGYRRSDPSDTLYGEQRPEREPQLLTAIPYYAWANRDARDMRAWIRE